MNFLNSLFVTDFRKNRWVFVEINLRIRESVDKRKNLLKNEQTLNIMLLFQKCVRNANKNVRSHKRKETIWVKFKPQ